MPSTAPGTWRCSRDEPFWKPGQFKIATRMPLALKVAEGSPTHYLDRLPYDVYAIPGATWGPTTGSVRR